MSLKMSIWSSLPCVSLSVTLRTRHAWIERVVIDTGCARTLLNQKHLRDAGLSIGAAQAVHNMVGAGGSDLGLVHIFDQVAVEDELAIRPFAVHVGPAPYGNDLGGLLGLDFLSRAGAVVNLREWTLEFAAPAVQSPP